MKRCVVVDAISRAEEIKDLIRSARDVQTVDKVAIAYGNEVAAMIEAGGVSKPLGIQIRNLAGYKRRELREEI
jgi:hypothetical protein